MTTDSPDVLTGGRWVRDGLIVRWVAEPKAVTSIHTLIACPTCHARVDQTCKTKGGKATTPHSTRLAPRLCPCGANVHPQKRMCNHCARESLQRSKNEYGRRSRAGRAA